VLMLRRTMAELRDVVPTLPPLPRFIEHDLHIPAGTKEGKLFRALCDQLQNAIDDKALSTLMKLELWMRVQQFLVHPQIYIEAMRSKLGKGVYPRPDWTPASDSGPGDGTTKWTACMAELQGAVTAGVPTIVFCNFRAEMDRVEEAAVKMGASCWSIRGGMGTEAVGAAVIAAREASTLEGGGKTVVVVVQIVSGGAGLNLQFCRRVLFLSQHWNPAVVHQAVGRAVRIGQKAVVDIHFFRCVDDVMDNIDARMMAIHGAKIAGARAICSSLYEGFAPKATAGFPLEESESESESESEEEDPTGP